MPLVEDNHMVETLTSNGADHPFDKWILPRGARCGKDLLYPETVDASVRSTLRRSGLGPVPEYRALCANILETIRSLKLVSRAEEDHRSSTLILRE